MCLVLIDALVELQQLPAVRSLRRLSLEAHDTFLTEEVPLVGDIVQQMSALQDLELRSGAVHRVDVLNVARAPCMAQLTRLQLDLGAGLKDLAAVAVACALRQVQRLSLVGACQSYAALPAAAQLTTLRDLCNTGDVCVGVQELRQLAPLTLLYSLTLPVDCTDFEHDQFVASMPHLCGVIRPQLPDSDDYDLWGYE